MKNSMNSGGVQRSVFSISAPESARRFTMAAPMAMQVKSALSPQQSESATPANTAAIISERRLARERKKRSRNESTVPSAAPTTRERPISSSGEISMFCTVGAAPLVRDCAMASEIANAARPIASSMATTESSVFVIVPCARYCRTTISVAAGAVAVAIAPSVSDSGRSNPQKISTTSTAASAAIA